LVFLALIVVAQSTVTTAQENAFRRFIHRYNKQYEDEEYPDRLLNYIATTKRVQEQNARSKELNSTARFGINKFADLSVEEFKALLGTRLPTQPVNAPVAQSTGTATFPTSWDWRTRGGITGQKNELQCGSCWAFTVAMAIESAYMIHKGRKDQPGLSTQQIIDCDTNDQGCNGGMPTTAYEYVVSAGGLETNSEYPYVGQTGTCNVTKSLVGNPITGYELVIPTGSTDEIAMAKFLASEQPISTAVDASSWQTYTSGVLLASQCGQNIDHGVQLVGYNGLDKNGYWIIRNMWGADWGENGFIRVQFGLNSCGLTSLPTAPTL